MRTREPDHACKEALGWTGTVGTVLLPLHRSLRHDSGKLNLWGASEGKARGFRRKGVVRAAGCHMADWMSEWATRWGFLLDKMCRETQLIGYLVVANKFTYSSRLFC